MPTLKGMSVTIAKIIVYKIICNKVNYDENIAMMKYTIMATISQKN